MRPYSLEFRKKIILAYETESVSMRQLAREFRVALSFVHKLIKHYRETGSYAPKQRLQQTPSKLNDEHHAVLRQLVEDNNDATLAELSQLLEQKTGLKVSSSTIDRRLRVMHVTRKKDFSRQRETKR